jgi:N-acetyl-anhydromuramyl-L-alanine amidase AmpD
VWDPSSNKSSRRGRQIDSIVIHTTEGKYGSAVSWLKNPHSKVSAHYVIREDGGEIRQLVSDEDAAWAQTYYNERGIGIECAGYASRASTWTPGLKAALVELVAWLAKTHGVSVAHPTESAYAFPNNKLDVGGLLSHGQIQPWDRSDPGPHFDWDEFVADVQARIDASGP